MIEIPRDRIDMDVSWHEPGCRVALKSETRRVRGYFLPLIMRFDCYRAYAFRALPGDVINRGKQTWLLIEGAQ